MEKIKNECKKKPKKSNYNSIRKPVSACSAVINNGFPIGKSVVYRRKRKQINK